MIRSFFLAAAGFAGAALLLGCGREEKLYHVSGTVTFEGNPVPAGTVFFDPVAGGGAKGQGFATIKNGEFDTAADGRGLAPGKYSIRVLGFDGKESNDAPRGKSLFPEYTTAHDQPADKARIEIKVPKAAK
jgi:hypothetical protein